MPQKSIKAVMDELTAMAQDKNTSPRAFADSFQAHSAELRAVFVNGKLYLSHLGKKGNEYLSHPTKPL